MTIFEYIEYVLHHKEQAIVHMNPISEKDAVTAADLVSGSFSYLKIFPFNSPLNMMCGIDVGFAKKYSYYSFEQTAHKQATPIIAAWAGIRKSSYVLKLQRMKSPYWHYLHPSCV